LNFRRILTLEFPSDFYPEFPSDFTVYYLFFQSLCKASSSALILVFVGLFFNPSHHLTYWWYFGKYQNPTEIELYFKFQTTADVFWLSNRGKPL